MAILLRKHLGAEFVDRFPSVWLPHLRVVVTVYVDDILAVGPPKALDELWQVLQCHVGLDGVGGVDRFLGR